MIQVQRLTNFSELSAKEWNHLLERSGNQSIFLTWTWLKTWWEVYGEDNEFWWLNVNDTDGTLIGSAPLYVRRLRNGLILPHRELRFIGTGAPVSPEHLDILAEPQRRDEVLSAIARYLLNHQREWDVLLLNDLSNKSSANNALKLADLLSGMNQIAMIEDQYPFAPYVSLPKTWDEYYESLGKWLRRTITRQRNKQTRELDMSFYVWTPKDGDFEGAFEKFEKLYGLRKETMSVENKFEKSAGYQKFHRLLASRFAEEGRLNLAFLKIGNREVACEYTFQYMKTLYSYQCGFDPEFGKNNVFKVLRSFVIEKAIKDGLTEFDLLRGEESYKSDWNAAPRKKQMLRSFSPTFYGGMLKGIQGLRRTGKRLFQKPQTSGVRNG